MSWQAWMLLGGIAAFGLVGMWLWNDPFNDELEEGDDRGEG
ncbi:MAG: hypothetical protein ACREA9_21115 [Pyrinomonadaceae bacterium]